MTPRRTMIASVAALTGAGLTPIAGRAADVPGKQHRVSMQVDESRADLMNLVLNNVTNISEAYAAKNEAIAIEIVAFGPGLAMFRADTSPVKARLAPLTVGLPNLVLSACGNTMHAMEKAEGKPVVLVPEARIVPAGVVRLIELQEQGWSYIRT